MKKVIVEPGTGVNKYYVRTTDLESFLACPYKWKYEDKKWDYSILEFGKIIHTYIQHLMLGVDDVKLTKNLTKGRPISEVSFISSLYSKIKEEGLINKGFIAEYPMQVQFIFGEDSIILEGTADMITTDGEILDFKTSSGDWGEYQIKSKKQWLIYSVLYNLLQNRMEGEQVFKYMLIIKNKTPRISWVNMTVNLAEGYKTVIEYLREFIHANKTNNFEAKAGSIYCQWCQLKKKGQCPLEMDL